MNHVSRLIVLFLFLSSIATETLRLFAQNHCFGALGSSGSAFFVLDASMTQIIDFNCQTQYTDGVDDVRFIWFM